MSAKKYTGIVIMVVACLALYIFVCCLPVENGDFLNFSTVPNLVLPNVSHPITSSKCECQILLSRPPSARLKMLTQPGRDQYCRLQLVLEFSRSRPIPVYHTSLLWLELTAQSLIRYFGDRVTPSIQTLVLGLRIILHAKLAIVIEFIQLLCIFICQTTTLN
jgi:hypothetical protein